MIFRDDGRDAEAVDWLRMAYEERQQQPSPNLQTIADDLEDEIAALKRLARPEEAAIAEGKLEAVRAAIKSVPQQDGEWMAVDGPLHGALLVELSFGSQTGGIYTRKELAQFVLGLREIVKTAGAGSCAGDVATPESTTLIFYGADAEAMFRVLEPRLRGERMCAGARVAIRQGERLREVFLPSRTM